ncbi:unnamed protein product [Clavelina lepadiformis]|uniref:Uncharacterized protein n=1 Tax=Clavelina lepadiformis TaxID=159417 RepID=A0ABP0FAM6_CLALP
MVSGITSWSKKKIAEVDIGEFHCIYLIYLYPQRTPMTSVINGVADSTVVSNASVIDEKESQGSKYDERQRLEKKTFLAQRLVFYVFTITLSK